MNINEKQFNGNFPLHSSKSFDEFFTFSLSHSKKFHIHEYVCTGIDIKIHTESLMYRQKPIYEAKNSASARFLVWLMVLK